MANPVCATTTLHSPPFEATITLGNGVIIEKANGSLTNLFNSLFFTPGDHNVVKTNSGSLLKSWGDVAIGVESDPYATMAQPLLDNLRVYSLLEHN